MLMGLWKRKYNKHRQIRTPGPVQDGGANRRGGELLQPPHRPTGRHSLEILWKLFVIFFWHFLDPRLRTLCPKNWKCYLELKIVQNFLGEYLALPWSYIYETFWRWHWARMWKKNQSQNFLLLAEACYSMCYFCSVARCWLKASQTN